MACRCSAPLWFSALPYREMFLNGRPPTVTEREKGAGLEIRSLLDEIRAVVEAEHTNLRKAG